jgi:hypothetical protein
MIRPVRTVAITAGITDTTATEAAADPVAVGAVVPAEAARAGEASIIKNVAIGTSDTLFYGQNKPSKPPKT